MAVYEGTEEMVAASGGGRFIVDRGTDSYWRRLSRGSLYLYLILMSKVKLTRERELETILTICIALVVIFLIGKQHHRYLLTISILLGLIGMFSHYLTTKITWAWMKLSEVMGAVMSRVILSIVFFGFVTPLAYLFRIFGNRDNLQLKRTKGTSYYTIRNHQFTPRDLDNLW